MTSYILDNHGRQQALKGATTNDPTVVQSSLTIAVEFPPSGAEKHPDFQVTLCIHFVTTNPNFAYIESE